MIKRSIICIALAGTPFEAAAQSVQDHIVRQLREQGYRITEIAPTWLGRVRIVSTRNGLERELVFVPNTGEILRDYWIDVDDEDDGPQIFNPGGGSSGGSGGGSSSDDDDDDDDEDDDNDEDEDDREDEDEDGDDEDDDEDDNEDDDDDDDEDDDDEDEDDDEDD